MKGSVKLFIASMVLFAASIGFFAGSFCKNQTIPDTRTGEMMPPPPRNGEMTPPPPNRHGPKGPAPEILDSVLQVTPEQKAALENNRIKSDSIFKELRKQKFEAEKSLGQALDSENENEIENAKKNVMEANKALLEHRINEVSNLNKILSKEQREKFRSFHKEMKNRKH